MQTAYNKALKEYKRSNLYVISMDTLLHKRMEERKADNLLTLNFAAGWNQMKLLEMGIYEKDRIVYN